MSEKMDFAGGKYTVINDNGKLTALRYGEPWGRDEDLVGDNLVHSMLVDSLRLKAQRNELLEALKLMLEQFTKTPSTLKDSEARIKAHAAIAQTEGQ